MNQVARIDDALRRLDSMASSTYRLDFRVTAQAARRVIMDLIAQDVSEDRRLAYLAKTICDKAAVRPQLVYRLQRTGQIRTVRVDSEHYSRIPHSQHIGEYDHGADWRDVAEDLKA